MTRSLPLLAAFAALAFAGCGDDDAQVSKLAVTAVEHTSSATTYQFELPEVVPAGPTRISLSNDGAEAHHAQLFRLNEGSTNDDLAEALATGDPAATRDIGVFVGGTGLVDAGETSQAEAVIDLEPGQYAFICFVEGTDGLPHLAHGMLRPFQVTAAAGQAPSAPAPDHEISLTDYNIDVPDRLPGDALLAVSNDAHQEPHEMVVGRLHDDATIEDLLHALSEGTPPRLTSIGGMQALAPGATALLQLDLEAGRYVFICHIPSPDGEAHYTKGMIEEVTIT